MNLAKTDFYNKKERKFFKKHPNLMNKYGEILEKLKNNPFEKSLKTHKLKGNLTDFYSCSLTYEYRIICIIIIQDNEITLVDIGTHNQVY